LDIAYELLSLFLFRTHMPPSLSFARMRTRTDTHTHTHTNACTAHTRAHTHTRKPTYTRMRTHMRPHRQYFVATCGWVHVYVSACEGGCVDGMWAHAFEFLCLCQHTASHCNTLQHTATHLQNSCNTLATYLQHASTHCNIL